MLAVIMGSVQIIERGFKVNIGYVHIKLWCGASIQGLWWDLFLTCSLLSTNVSDFVWPQRVLLEEEHSSLRF